MTDCGYEFFLRTDVVIDGDVKDDRGLIQPIVCGNAVFDDGLDLTAACLSLGKYKIGIDTFKLVAELVLEKDCGDMVIFANKNVKAPHRYGVALLKKGDGFVLNIGDGKNSLDYCFDVKAEVEKPIVLELTVNRDESFAELLINGKGGRHTLESVTRYLTFDALEFVIGRDAEKDCSTPVRARLCGVRIYC